MATNKQTSFLLFGLGAALGSAVGLILGSLLTFWIGEGTLRAIQRGFRRLSGGDHPNFEALLQ
jgi:membrane protein YqaA with SNARE-associated domain